MADALVVRQIAPQGAELVTLRERRFAEYEAWRASLRAAVSEVGSALFTATVRQHEPDALRDALASARAANGRAERILLDNPMLLAEVTP